MATDLNDPPHEKFSPISSQVVRRLVESGFTEEFRKGYYLYDIAFTANGDAITHWRKSITPCLPPCDDEK